MRRLKIVSPCTEDFDAMPADGRTRHCDKCNKSVLDLTLHRGDEVISLLDRREAACVRLLRHKRTGHVVLAAAAAVAITACSSAALDAPAVKTVVVQPQAPDAAPVPDDYEMLVGDIGFDDVPPKKR